MSKNDPDLKTTKWKEKNRIRFFINIVWPQGQLGHRVKISWPFLQVSQIKGGKSQVKVVLITLHNVMTKIIAVKKSIQIQFLMCNQLLLWGMSCNDLQSQLFSANWGEKSCFLKVTIEENEWKSWVFTREFFRENWEKSVREHSKSRILGSVNKNLYLKLMIHHTSMFKICSFTLPKTVIGKIFSKFIEDSFSCIHV